MNGGVCMKTVLHQCYKTCRSLVFGTRSQNRMNNLEKTVLREHNTDILPDLDLRQIAPFLFQKGVICSDYMRKIFEEGGSTRNECQKFLVTVTEICPFETFLASLRYENAYDFLADQLERTLSQKRQESIKEESNVVYAGENIETTFRERHTTGTENIKQPVQKIRMSTKHRRQMVALSQKLKVLSHNGQMGKFREICNAIAVKFGRRKLEINGNAKENMRLADMWFVTLDEEAGAKRVRNDASSYGSDVFINMQNLIPFTSDPTVSSMTYLARYGSAIAMKGLRDDGFAHVQYAKQHSQQVTPCKETGLVYYIEVNHLTQKYEDQPLGTLKGDILRTANTALSHFSNEEEEVKRDYERMLMLKIAFCHLGIGVFCRRIPGVEIRPEDKESAKACFDYIERPSVWNGMEKRRKMFFQVAKSEYYRHDGQMDLARVHALHAREIAKENAFMTELGNIETTIREIEIATQTRIPEQETDMDVEAYLAELGLGDGDDEDDDDDDDDVSGSSS